MAMSIDIKMDSDAFADQPRQECARILQTIIWQLQNLNIKSGYVHDINGNNVGIWTLTEE